MRQKLKTGAKMRLTKELHMLRNEDLKAFQKKIAIVFTEEELNILLSWIFFLKSMSNLGPKKEDFKLQRKIIKKLMELDE